MVGALERFLKVASVKERKDINSLRIHYELQQHPILIELSRGRVIDRYTEVGNAALVLAELSSILRIQMSISSVKRV